MKIKLILIVMLFPYCQLLPSAQEYSKPIAPSYFKLTTSNGLIVAVYNTKENRIDYVYPHIFANYDSGFYVHPFVGNITLNSTKRPTEASYMKNTQRPGLWHIAWVRDGSYAIQAMTRLGMFTEARKGLEFMLKAPSGHYKHYIYEDGKDYGVGTDYQISVASGIRTINISEPYRWSAMDLRHISSHCALIMINRTAK